MRHEVRLELGDVSYMLKPDFNSLIELERQLGRSLQELAGELAAGRLALEHLAKAVSCCARGNPTFEVVGEALAQGYVAVAQEAVADMLLAIFGDGAGVSPGGLAEMQRCFPDAYCTAKLEDSTLI